MSDMYVFNVRIQLLNGNGLPLRFYEPPPPITLADFDASTPTAPAFIATEHVAFRHSTEDGDPTEALRQLLAPHLSEWVANKEGAFGTKVMSLSARIDGDGEAAHAQVGLPGELYDQPIARKCEAERLLYEVCNLLVERVFTGQHRG